jgi:hypothetical protein
MVPNALDACLKHIPSFPRYTDIFNENLIDLPKDLADQIAFNTSLYHRDPSFSPDNPGHVLLLMRGISGRGVVYLYRAYIYALATVLGMGTDPSKIDRTKLIFVHAGICKALGSAYYAPPIPYATKSECFDYLSILLELILSESKDVIGLADISDDERRDHIEKLKDWHSPKYIRGYKNESTKWSFDRPRERASAINFGLMNIK